MSKMKFSGSGVWQRNLLIALCSFLAVVFVVLALGTAYVHNMLNRLGRVDPEDEYTLSQSEVDNLLESELSTVDPSSTETHPSIEDVTIPTEAPYVPTDHGDHIINIVLVGQDRRPGQGRQRSDTMILLTFNKSQNTITLTSFMRDMYVQIPGYKNHKMNAAYAWGGFKLLNNTLKQNFGVFVDGDVEVDFDGFTEIIDMLGGVEITLTQAEAKYINEGHGMNLSAGTQFLDGYTALQYARIRYIDSDYRRAERQRTVILSILNRYKSKSVDEMLAIMNQMLPMVTTNMSNAEILKLAGELLPMLATAKINTLRIPVDGTFRGGTVEIRPGYIDWFQYNIDFEANRTVLQSIFAK